MNVYHGLGLAEGQTFIGTDWGRQAVIIVLIRIIRDSSRYCVARLQVPVQLHLPWVRIDHGASRIRWPDYFAELYRLLQALQSSALT